MIKLPKYHATSSLSREFVSGVVGDPILIETHLHAEVKDPQMLFCVLHHVVFEAIDPALQSPPLIAE